MAAAEVAVGGKRAEDGRVIQARGGAFGNHPKGCLEDTALPKFPHDSSPDASETERIFAVLGLGAYSGGG
jgi:hypothetical protein